MSSVALTEQARRDATKKTTMRLKLSKVGGANLSRERITPWLGPLREACQQARRTTPASSDHCDSPDSRHAVFLLSESHCQLSAAPEQDSRLIADSYFPKVMRSP